MKVPLHKYPEMLSTTHISQILGCSMTQSALIVSQMEHIDISVGKGRQRTLRVSKEAFAKRYGLKPSLYLAKAGGT